MAVRQPMNRREFLKKLFQLGGKAALMSTLPLLATRNKVMASKEERDISNQIENLSLRELVENKMHHGDRRFLNPFNLKEHGNFLRVLKWKFFSENKFKGLYDQERVIPVNVDWKPIREHKGCAVTFLKHASIIIKDQDQFLMVDPVFDSLLWYTDFSPLAFDMNDIHPPHHVLITHGHYDHLDKGSLARFSEKTNFITPLGYNEQFNELAIKRRIQLDWFQSFSEEGREIICLPCNHWTMRNPFIGPNTSLWSSFLIKTKSGITIYVSGDTAYFDRFSELGEEFSIDLAIFNLGAYEPRWFMADSHINPIETVKAFRELKAKHLMVVHWGGFRLGDEPVYMPPQDIRKAMDREGLTKSLIHLDPGQTLFYDDGDSIRIH